MLQTRQHIISRPFQNDQDFWRVRDLLIETYPITPTGFNWEIRRWDGWRCHHENLDWNPDWEKRIRLWETEAGKLVTVVHPDRHGDAFLELHPDYRQLEEEMIAWAEEQLAVLSDHGHRRQLDVFVFDYDSPRRRLLSRRGFEEMPYGGVTRRLRFGNRPLPEVAMAEGYTLRSTRPNDEDD